MTPPPQAGGGGEPWAVFSDVHSNLEALEAVIKDIRRRGVPRERTYFLGDAVGYGPRPNECVKMIAEESAYQVAGNHDWAALERTDTTYFNPYALAAIEWTRDNLEPETVEIMNSWPLTQTIEEHAALLVHATPLDPPAWRYILSLEDAELNFPAFEETLCFIGHSHKPNIIERAADDGEIGLKGAEALLAPGARYIINDGSVGQPRDRDPRSCYALMEGDRARLVRVGYDIGKTQSQMKEAGLPDLLVKRIAEGR